MPLSHFPSVCVWCVLVCGYGCVVSTVVPSAIRAVVKTIAFVMMVSSAI